MIKILSLILFILLALVGRERGIKTFFTFYLSLLLIIFYIIFMSFGLNAIILAIITCILASVISLFMLNGYNVKTKASFISIMVVLVFIFLLVFFIGKSSSIQGFSNDSIESIGAYSFEINYDMCDVFIGMYLVCSIGTLIDTSISISSAVNEVYENNKKITQKELFKSGMNIGHDILSTTINTLYFALVCGFIGFFLWHRGGTLGYLLNYKVFAQEVIKVLIAFIGSILIIPITAFISSHFIINDSY
ncbi:MAG: YibE/F family protein [Bacilli bacterium]|nr:YibE/F family protein [Bacilli bacterium]